MIDTRNQKSSQVKAAVNQGYKNNGKTEQMAEFTKKTNLPIDTKISKPESPPVKSNSDDSIFLFIVVHTLNNNEITAKIVNVF